MVITPKIAAVSYLNTIPFIYGIRHSSAFDADVVLCPPSECARKFIDKEVDIALLPAAAVPALTSTEIVTEYCIGAMGAVRTVVVVSNTPIKNVKRLFLDAHSLTSVQLCGYLAAKVWNIAPEWINLSDYSRLTHAEEGDAFLLIGDKVFDHEGEFRYSYDLAEEWHQATGKPFAFAVWVARKGLPYEVTDALQHALTEGVEHIYEAIVEFGYADKEYAYQYLTRNIDFLFDKEKHEALQQFWDSGLRVVPKADPG